MTKPRSRHKTDIKWYSAVLDNMTNGDWFYIELKAKTKPKAQQAIKRLVRCTSGHWIEIKHLQRI